MLGVSVRLSLGRFRWVRIPLEPLTELWCRGLTCFPVEEKLKSGELELMKAPSDQVVFFDDRTWHQGTRAVKNGWRLFIRASWDTNRKPTNEFRRQVQVYMENPMEGW